MKKHIYKPATPESRMTIACFVSGSGTNYERIVEKNPNQRYIVFSNEPGCEGIDKAIRFGHRVVELSHKTFLAPAKERLGTTQIPRNCPERVAFEQKAVKLIEEAVGGQPDLICLAGYNQWNTDWMVDRYYPRILNVHPGDTVKGYVGLHWVPTAKAIIAGDGVLKSTLFLADKGEDTGPVLMQSTPLNIEETLERISDASNKTLVATFKKLTTFIRENRISSYQQFKKAASEDNFNQLKSICLRLQSELKVNGDWEIYPFGVHELIGNGRVEVEGRGIYVDGCQLPLTGFAR